MIEEQRIHIRDYVKIIKKRKSIIAVFFFATFVVVAVGTLFTTPVYEATTQLLVEKNDPTLLTGKSFGTRYEPEFFATQSQIITSQNVTKKVVKILALDTNYEKYFPDEDNKPSLITAGLRSIKSFVTGLFKSSAAPNGANGESLEKSKADILADLIKDNIVVSPVAESSLLDVSYRSENPIFAKLIANTVAQAYMEEVAAIRKNASGDTIKWMTDKADVEKDKLAQSERALQTFMKENDIITVENHLAIIPQKLADLNNRMTAAESKREELETLRNQIAEMMKTHENAETIPGLAENKVLQSLRDQILKSEQNITELSHKYGKKHPVMLKALADLSILQEKKEQEITKSIQAINNEYELARNNEVNARKLLDKTKNEVFDLNEKFIQYGILKREVDTNRTLYDALNLNIKDQGVTEYSQQVNVWVTEQAELPESPVSPNKMRNVVLGVALGLLGGIGCAFFLEYLDNTVKDPDEVEARTGINVIGVVELLTQNKENKALIAPLGNSPFALSESFRALRTSILLSSSEQPQKKILISSMLPDEGKTTTALNLAKTVALIENKVLLIDGDLRRPSLHKIFNLPNSKGLSSYLAGNDEEALIHRLDDSCLYVMSSGPIPSNPSELFSSNRLQEMLASLEAKFDFIIIDSAPILGVPDSLLLSRSVDGTIFVSRAGRTSHDALHRGLKLFKDIKSPVLGIVINTVDMKQPEYEHYYGQYSYT